VAFLFWGGEKMMGKNEIEFFECKKTHKDFVRIDRLFNLVLGESIQFPIQK